MAEAATLKLLSEDVGRIRATIRGMNLDIPLVLLIAAAVVFSCVIQSSALHEKQHLLPSHMLKMAIGFAGMIAVAQLKPGWIYHLVPFGYLATIALLVLVLFIGDTTKGSSRWLDFPGLPRFQPSEMAKITIPLMLAWYLADREWPLRLIDLAVSVIVIALPVYLIFRQPDLGTTLLVTAGSACVIFLAGIRWKVVFWSSAVLIPAAVIGAPMVLPQYQLDRIKTLLDPEADVLGSGWNILQSKTALGSGGLFGKGFGEGTQSQLDFLPEGHTDFILAVVGEELGFVGSASLVVLMLAIFLRCMYLCNASREYFTKYATGGIATAFILYALANCMMVCGLLPVFGKPLPMISFGGSSALTFLAGFGVIMALRSRSMYRAGDVV